MEKDILENMITMKFFFEGNYINGELNGNTKKYFTNKFLIFEGEYKRGQPNGFGKEYYLDGSLFFEGEYFYGRKWKGKGYDMKGNIIYELENGNGYIKCHDLDKKLLLFECEYLNGLKNGKGKEYDFFSGKLKFEGEFINDKKNGKWKK